MNGDITLAPSTAVTIGLGTGAGAFNLSNAELGDITTTGSLVVGDATSGNITADEVDVVGQDLSLVTGGTINDDDDTGAAIATTGTLTLDAGSTIGDSGGAAGLDIDVGALTVTGSGGDVTLRDVGSTSSTTYSVTTGGAHDVSITQSNNPLAVSGISTTGTVSLTSLNGVITTSGTITSGGSLITLNASDGVSVGGSVTGGQINIDADTDTDGTGDFSTTAAVALNSGGASIEVVADDVTLFAGSSLNAGAGTVTLRPATTSAINVGSPTGDFDLTDAELDQITAGSLVIGDTSTRSGAITIDGVTYGGDLTLRTNSTIDDSDDTGVAVDAANLTLTSNGAIGSANAQGLDIDVGALTVTGSGGDVTVTDAGSTDT
ncbi:MAG: hypothetical protein JJ957_20615, partial [Pseudomonadales bacterium]|nr:hypothetical protein [Pseudomonadales bacterium]